MAHARKIYDAIDGDLKTMLISEGGLAEAEDNDKVGHSEIWRADPCFDTVGGWFRCRSPAKIPNVERCHRPRVGWIESAIRIDRIRGIA